jgi:catechol 2,3-dioxygenase-like lactoylglutathione lyase family enzyme
MSDTPPLNRWHHMGITVRDIDKSEAWYRDVLGFDYAFSEDHPDGGGFAKVMVRPDTMMFLGLHHHDANGSEEFGAHRTGLDHVGIQVDNREDIARWAEHLDRHGVSRSEPVDGKLGDAAYTILSFGTPTTSPSNCSGWVERRRTCLSCASVTPTCGSRTSTPPSATTPAPSGCGSPPRATAGST